MESSANKWQASFCLLLDPYPVNISLAIVLQVSLQDNYITDDMVPLVMQFVFSASYLKELDLRKNNLTAEGIRVVMEQLTQIEGVTKVTGVEGHLRAEDCFE